MENGKIERLIEIIKIADKLRWLFAPLNFTDSLLIMMHKPFFPFFSNFWFLRKIDKELSIDTSRLINFIVALFILSIITFFFF